MKIQKKIIKSLLVISLLNYSTVFADPLPTVQPNPNITSEYVLNNPNEIIDNVKIENLTNTISSTIKELNSIELKESILEKNIKNNSIKIKETEKKLKELQEHINKIIRINYMNNEPCKYLSILLTSKNLSNFIARTEFLQLYLTENKKNINLYKKLQKDLETTQTNLKNQNEMLKKIKNTQIEKIKNLQKEKEDLGKKIQAKYNINTSNNEINTFSRGCNDPRKKSIVEFASMFIGMPYFWGGESPSTSFDCSGLVQYSFLKAGGIQLPRTAKEQQQIGIEIPYNQAAYGDLVFFGYPAHHVGIYLGNGMMLHSPHTNDFIKISSVNNPTNFKRIIP